MGSGPPTVPNRELKPKAITTQLDKLDGEITRLNEFIAELEDAPGQAQITQEAERISNFSYVYNSIPQRLNKNCEQLRELREKLQEMLL